ncbi:ShlB/FhaC/HecB family hemolysin secretion/activation protein [Xenococcus sp. PCC 7305]|uniref:ShlB/FhaC/HecB family hemolysin secretion/activation protein n=1 Tax=Xenococcus sp. PCC 7305 TaxID=102125 RepID=UPI0002F467E9|nr:ShlB/FhaC/HecB family hemolysin secretion/activation protein [Xenococcus sp. PCC 7305]
MLQSEVFGIFLAPKPIKRIVRQEYLLLKVIIGLLLLTGLSPQSLQAQESFQPQEIDIPEQDPESAPTDESILEVADSETSDPEEELVSTSGNVGDIPEQIIVNRFEVVGNSIFPPEQIDVILAAYQDRPLSLAELFEARSAITKLYTEQGYVNSGAYLPPQELDNGTVKIAVLEGTLEDIKISGVKRLNDSYVRSRIERYSTAPINVDELLEALQLLRLDPLIENVSAELSAGINPGTSLLEIEVEEADNFTIRTQFDNQRSPSVGTNRRGAGLEHSNLLGFGDRITFDYINTEGSDDLDFSYALPINSKNGTLRLAYGISSNDVIEDPFTPLDIETESEYLEFGYRQPLINTPQREFVLGLNFSYQDSKTKLLDEPFRLSPGADEDGNTRISALRFFQEYVNRNEQQVLALRSQFSFGIDVLDATINNDQPDSLFLAWRGQSQWIRRLDEDFLLVLRGDLQVSTTDLVPVEQFRIGGGNSVRGYRQDFALADSGLTAGAEMRIPLLRVRKLDGIFHLTPFVDLGSIWNTSDVEIDTDFLASVGLGLNFSTGTGLNARIDWGIPLVTVDKRGDSLQEDGIHFSLDFGF